MEVCIYDGFERYGESIKLYLKVSEGRKGLKR